MVLVHITYWYWSGYDTIMQSVQVKYYFHGSVRNTGCKKSCVLQRLANYLRLLEITGGLWRLLELTFSGTCTLSVRVSVGEGVDTGGIANRTGLGTAAVSRGTRVELQIGTSYTRGEYSPVTSLCVCGWVCGCVGGCV